MQGCIQSRVLNVGVFRISNVNKKYNKLNATPILLGYRINMHTKIIDPVANAHQYPLLIKSLLLSGKRYQPHQEIVYSDVIRYNYVTLYERICKLANVLTEAGIKGGDTVAMMDWDSHRYLEAYFAVPMIGAVLHHVNIRLSSEQIAYTMNHAEDDFVLVHDDFIEEVNSSVMRSPQYASTFNSSVAHKPGYQSKCRRQIRMPA